MKKYSINLLFLSTILSSCVTFNLNLNSYDNLPQGLWSARVNGSWNNWNQGFDLIDSNNDGIYSNTYCNFAPGDYEFLFAITGDFDNWSNWGIIGNPPLNSECDFNPNDSYVNYGFTIADNDLYLPVHSFDCCGITDCSDWEGCEIGGIKTDNDYLYGRFEVRMKSIGSSGVVSSFFTYNDMWVTGLGNLNWNEIDIEMTGNLDSAIHFTTHHPGEPNSWSIGETINLDVNPHTSFNTYAFEWTPNNIIWFVNDEEMYSQPYSIVDDLNMPQKVMMNVWPAAWTDWSGEWDNQDIPRHAYYDYVKYYSYNPGNGDYGTGNNFKLVWMDDFNYFDQELWDDNSSGSFNGNLCEFTPSNTNYYNGHLILSLTDSINSISCNQINGDSTNDGNLNVSDIVEIVFFIINEQEMESCKFLATDSNVDGFVNVTDIVFWIDLILSS